MLVYGTYEYFVMQMLFVVSWVHPVAVLIAAFNMIVVC